MTKELGMYALHDKKPRMVKIGIFTLCKQSADKIWIQRDNGEGGEFKEAELEKVIAEFYDDNF